LQTLFGSNLETNVMRKVTVDLDALVLRGIVSKMQAEQIAREALKGTIGVASLIVICVFAAGFIAAAWMLDPEMQWLPVWSTALLVAGVFAVYAAPREFRVAAHAATTIGAAALSVKIVLSQGVGHSVLPPVWFLHDPFLQVAALLFAAGAITMNLGLIGAAVLATTPSLNVGTFYDHAMYALVVKRPATTIFVYGAVAIAAAIISRVPHRQVTRTSLVVFGTALFMVNLAFWVGSLWGDREHNLTPQALALGWAALSGIAMIWAFIQNKRSVVILSGVFLAINMYTQWFERFLMNPRELLFACTIGIVLVAVAAWYWSRRELSAPAFA
jgi:iron complex transport system permease protein